MKKKRRRCSLRAAVFLVLALSFALSGLAQPVDISKRPRQVERSHDYDALHYRIELRFDLDEKTFSGSNTITLRALRDDFDTCLLDAEEIVIEGAEDAAGHPLEFEQTDRHLIVRLRKAIDYGETTTFRVAYRGTNPERGLFFDDETPDHPQMVSTASWPEYAHHWVPCYDYPNDKVTQETIITVRESLKVLANGRLRKVTHNSKDGTVTYEWSQDKPHSTYLFLLAIGPFVVIEDALGDLPVNYWVYEKDVRDARWIFKKTPQMIAFFQNLYGYPYPWAKYDQVVTPRVGGGMENTTATGLGLGVIHDRRAEQDFSWEKTIAHEVAHQWWGDLITLRSWEHTWLNESFGTYSDYLYTRHEKGEEEGAFDLQRKKNQYLREAHTRYIRPIVFDRYERPQQNFDSHTYPKGAVVLHMLRFILGDRPFFETLKHFLHKHAFQPVDTHDFMVAVKEATGQNMDWFFEQFVFKPGHPVFEITSSWDEAEGKVKLRLLQVQDTTQGVPIYRVPVIIGIHTPSGKFSEKVWIEKREHVFAFPVDEKPLMVRFDEGNHLLKEWEYRKDVEELLFQLEHDDVIGRAWAAGELARYKDDPRAADALIKSAKKDPFWGVREKAVEVLGSFGRREDTGLLVEKCRDENSRVRTAAIRALGNRGTRELVPFFKQRFEKDTSYLAQAEALRAIGKCGTKDDLPFLERASRMPSPRRILRSAATFAIDLLQKRKKRSHPRILCPVG